MAAEKGCRGFGIALEGNVNQRDALLLSNLLHGDVRGSARAWRSIGDRAGVGLGGSEEFRKCLPPSIAADHNPERVSRQTDDVGKIRGGIERGLCHERLPENGPGKLRDRVAIRFRLSKKREGTTFVVHVECKGPGGSQLGDVIFTPREDKIIDFSDLDQTYKAVLH